MGKFHFTKDTVEASIWCNRCNKATPWRVLQGKRAYCIPCYQRDPVGALERGGKHEPSNKGLFDA